MATVPEVPADVTEKCGTAEASYGLSSGSTDGSIKVSHTITAVQISSADIARGGPEKATSSSGPVAMLMRVIHFRPDDHTAIAMTPDGSNPVESTAEIVRLRRHTRVTGGCANGDGRKMQR